MIYNTKKKLDIRLGKPVVGCGSQASECLAMAVRGSPGNWAIAWAMYGQRFDPVFYAGLTKKVWRRPFWVSPWETGMEQESVVSHIDLSFQQAAGRRIGGAEKSAALRTQMLGHFSYASEPHVMLGLEIRGPDQAQHLVGGVARESMINQQYAEWKRKAKIIKPHIGSTAAALANLYLGLYPEDARKTKPDRLLVLEGRESAYAVLMQDWRLIEAIRYQLPANQELDESLLAHWSGYMMERNHMNHEPDLLVIQTGSRRGLPVSCEVWDPFSVRGIMFAEPSSRNLVEQHPDLAAIAFGMALQGG